MGPGGVCPMANVISKTLYITVERSWWLRQMAVKMQHHAYLQERGNYRPLSITSVPWKVMKQILLEDISNQRRGKKVIGSIQHGFIMKTSSSCLTKLIVFCDEMIGFVDKGRIVDVVWTFDIVSHSILVATLVRYGLDKWIVNCVENYLCCWLKGSVVQILPKAS